MKGTYSVYSEELPEVFSARYKDTEETEKKRFHLHRQMEIIIPLSDNMYCRTERTEMHIPVGSVLLISSMNLHYIVSPAGSGSCRRYVIYFSPEFTEGLSTPEVNLLESFLMNPSEGPRVLDIPGSMRKEMYDLARRLAEDTDSGPAGSAGRRYREMEKRLLLGEMLLRIHAAWQISFPELVKDTGSSHTRLVYEICEYVKQNYDREITLEEMADRFYVSKTQLFYIFREVLGTTLREYIIQYRLMKAKDMLINTDLPVEMISQKVGYTLHSFSRVFSDRVGISPLRYRKQYGAVAVPSEKHGQTI